MAHSLSLVHVVRPATPDANAPATPPPLLLLLHGVGANEGQMTALAPAFDPRCIGRERAVAPRSGAQRVRLVPRALHVGRARDRRGRGRCRLGWYRRVRR